MDMYSFVMFFLFLTIVGGVILAATALAIRINHTLGRRGIGRQPKADDTVYNLCPQKRYLVTQDFIDSCDIGFYRGQTLTLKSVQYNLWDRSYQLICEETTAYLNCDDHQDILNRASQYFTAAPVSAETHAAIKRLYSVVL